MKRCPQCKRVETDDALAYCRVDGTTLVSDSGSVSGDVGTMKFGSSQVSSEVDTNILPHTSTTPEINRNTGPTTFLSAQVPGTPQELSGPKRLRVVLPLAALFVVI